MTTRLERGTYIGGHEVSSILGMNPYGSIADVYADIVHKDAPDIGDKPVVRRGRIIEPGFIDWLEEEWGLSLQRDVFVRDDVVPYMAGTLDALEVLEDGSKVVHEFTSTTTRTYELWDEDDPAKYKWFQTQYYMSLAKAQAGWIHLFLADTGDIRHYRIVRSDVAIEAMREEVEDFWLTHVLTETPPVVDVRGYPGDVADAMVKRLYPVADDDTPLDATANLVELSYAYKDASAKAKEAEGVKKRIAAEIRQQLGAHDKAVFETGYVSHKNTKGRTSTDWESMARWATKDLPHEEQVAMKGTFTSTKPGHRTLRVHIKKEKQT